MTEPNARRKYLFSRIMNDWEEHRFDQLVEFFAAVILSLATIGTGRNGNWVCCSLWPGRFDSPFSSPCTPVKFPVWGMTSRGALCILAMVVPFGGQRQAGLPAAGTQTVKPTHWVVEEVIQ